MTEELTFDQILEEIKKIDESVIQLPPQILKERIQYVQQTIQFQKRELMSLRASVENSKQQQKDIEKRLNQNKQLPMLISTVSELVEVENDGVKTQGIILKTSSRQTIYCPSSGLVPQNQLKPGDLIAVNRDTFLIYEKLPTFYDARVKKMLVAEKPTDTFDQVGGMDHILKLVDEAILLPFRRPDLFEKVGIKPSRGLLLYGPPGVGKTLIARCIANAADCIFLNLCATELIQVYIGEGSHILQEVFDLAKEFVDFGTINGQKQPPSKQQRGALIYIDEIDAIGTRRMDSEQRSDREVARTLMTLLNLMDGFISSPFIKVIASTNRVDVLDPALVRSNRFDRKIECTAPNLAGRTKILQIHSAAMRVSQEVNLGEIAKECEGFSGAMLKAVCNESGMACMRRAGRSIEIRDFSSGINIVANKKREGGQGVVV